MRGCGLTLERMSSGAVRIALRGELDLNHAYSFDEELRRVEQDRPHCIVLDLRELNFMDSCGVGRLVAARRRARRAGRRLVLVRGGRAVQLLLALTGVDETFEIVGDVPSSPRCPDAQPIGVVPQNAT
jgi:anti-sigma B factor antagonist